MRRAALAILVAALAWAHPGRAAEAPKTFALHEAPKALPGIQFEDGEGQARKLTDLHGRIVVLNVWATWCVPCRREMPTLDRLQTELGGADFQVIALSIDRGGAEAVRKFYAEIGIRHLAIQLDTAGAALQTLGIIGLPTTLLIDREGREIGRLIGPADWDTPEMVAFLKSFITPQTGAPPAAQQGEKRS